MNPIYTGIPPFPCPGIVSDEEFAKAAAIFIEKEGVQEYILLLLRVLRRSMMAAMEGLEVEWEGRVSGETPSSGPDQ